MLVPDPDHGAVDHLFHRVHDFLDLARRYILSATDD
jgi:hypothetical protein